MKRPAGEAEREIAIAKRLDPLSVPINIDQAYILHYYDRNEEALRSVKLALEMNPKFAPAYFWLGRIYTSLPGSRNGAPEYRAPADVDTCHGRSRVFVREERPDE